MGPGGVNAMSARSLEDRTARELLDEPDFLELRRHDLLTEGLDDVFVGPGVHGPGDVADVVLRGAEDHLRLVAFGQTAQIAQELVPVHHRHVPVEQHASGMSARQTLSACSPSSASEMRNERVSRMRRATLRMTAESSTMRQCFMDGS